MGAIDPSPPLARTIILLARGGASHLPICFKVQEGWSKVNHAETVLVIAFFRDFSVTVVGQMVKTPPPPTESVSTHRCLALPME